MRRLALAFFLSLAPARAQDEALPWSSLLPEETVALVECDDLRGLLDSLLALAHPLPAPAQLGQLAVTVAVAATLGTTLHGAIADLAPGAVALAIVLPREGRPVPLLLARITAAERARARGARLRGVGVHVEEGLLALAPTPGDIERWRRFRTTTHPRLVPRSPPEGAGAPPPALRAWVDVQRLRRERSLFERLDAGGRFFVGPIAAALDRATNLRLALRLDADALALDVDLDGTVRGAEPAARLLAAGATPRARLALPATALGALELDRSLRGYLQHLELLLPATDATRVRGEAANLDLIIGGGSFVDDLLGGLAEPLRFVILGEPPADVPPDDDTPPRPRVDLPGFALLAEVETERAEQLLQRGFYRFSAILSAQRAMQKLPARLPQVVADGDLRFHVMRGPAFPGVGDPPTGEQIEATLVFAHGHVVLASTLACARQVVSSLVAAPATALRGDSLRLRGATIAEYLRRNASTIALGRVLDEGESRTEAERFVDGLAAAAAMIEGLEIAIQPGDAITRARLTLTRAGR